MRHVLRYAVVMLVLIAAPAAAQVQTLSLEEALSRAEEASEAVTIARAGVRRAEGERLRARSEFFPQLFGSAGYTRTLKSEFEVLSSGADTTSTSSEPCGEFAPDPGLPLDERVDSLEAAVRCMSTANPFAAFSDLPFGREHQVNLGLSLSQTLFAGGRVRAQASAASANRSVAELSLSSARAQLVLDVAEAYYNAALADRLYAIAQSTLEQAERTLSQVRLAYDVGNQPEFELLRAQVSRDTQEPLVIQRAADRDLAYMRLKQLLNMPLETELTLTTELGGAQLTPVVSAAQRVLDLPLDTALDARAVVRQAELAVDAQENLFTVARSQRWPAITLSSQYGRVAYPTSGIPEWQDFRTNWTIAASLQLPLFTGGRIKGEEMMAAAAVEEARARLTMTRELAALDTRSAVERLQAAEASWLASSGTVEQAQRAYSIAEVRFQEGVSTQLELADSRILLEQAQANRAVAARELQVARLRVALLPWLPLGSASGAPAMQQQAPPQAAPRQTTPAAPAGSVLTRGSGQF